MFKDIKQVMKDSVLYGIGNVAVKLVGFILIPLYTDAEYFSTADYGLMGVIGGDITNFDCGDGTFFIFRVDPLVLGCRISG